ncbi:hypothetical protein GCM10009765_34070 [Fodinicola feengrottensis]|uniref:Nudix hydrolase domain-containing protein n=1 Tax=Fodinicola feengrottensis TaxID=435914 RepID=A0ABN2H517_9ACTN
MTADDVIERAGARVLLINPDARLLMMHAFDPGEPNKPPYWITVGGGIGRGEDTLRAAVRELAEETGLRASPEELTGPVFHDEARFTFEGRFYRQTNTFFVLRCGFLEVDSSGWEDVERRSCHGYRWWSADELAATDELFFPTELPDLIREAV